MRIVGYLLLLLCLSLPLRAQDANDDRGFLTGLIEDNLSGGDRSVRIDGFAGALSSRATFDELTISDAEGVWLTIRGGAISWNRSALLSGRIEIAEMTASEILLPRLAVSESEVQAEASGFSLPELPVSVSIGQIRADRVVLGAPVLGTPLEVSMIAEMRLAGGAGDVALQIARIDGQDGQLDLTAAYSNASRDLTLDLLATEAEGGIVATKLGLPDAPSLTFAVKGSGLIDDFTADISLSSDRARRLSGQVSLLTSALPDGGGLERGFRVQLGGDISPLLLPEYRRFFGDDVTLVAEGRQEPSGRLVLSQLDIDAEAVDLAGRVVLAPDGLPQRLDIALRLGIGGQEDILLPIAGTPTFLRSGQITLDYDAVADEGWRLAGVVQGLRRSDIAIESLRLDGSGRIGRDVRGSSVDGAGGGIVGGTLRFDGSGIVPADPALAEALGPSLSGQATFYAEPDAPLKIPSFRVAGADFAASGRLSLAGLDSALTLAGRVEAELQDISRFSALAGRELRGAAGLDATGSVGLLSGIFDLDATVEGRDLVVSQPELDRLLRGQSRVALSVARDTEGTELRGLTLEAQNLAVTAQGTLRTGASALTATLDFSDLATLGPRYRGALRAEAELTESGSQRRIQLAGTGRDLAVGQSETDRLLAGLTQLAIDASLEDGQVRLNGLTLDNPQMRLTADGRDVEGVNIVDVNGRLANFALLAPGFPGPLTIAGDVAQRSDGYGLDLALNGPGQTDARATGTLASGFERMNVAIAGTVQSALLNPFIEPRNVQGLVRFDLGVNGAPSLNAVSGRVDAAGARLVAPALGISLDGIDASVTLDSGRAAISTTASVVGGGRVSLSGPVDLSAPYNGDLSINLTRVRLRDPELYDTRVDGTLSVSGPLAGGAAISGAVALDQTEVRVPSTGLGGTSPIPDIAHVAEPAAVRATRARAGLLQEAGNGQGGRSRPFALNLSITAPNQIFVRGRGLDAELGGSLQLGGTTDDVQAIGQFDLVRGRLDILGQRFVLDEGRVQMQGSLTPFIRFAASTESDGYTTTVLIEGPASEPEISFLSSPDLPEEEVLSRLLFGRGLTSLSAFQAAQLASAVATLAGRGGEGIVGRLRNSFGLDDFDVTTDDAGGTAVRAGKYLSDNLYTDVTIGSEGTSEINLNLDVTPQITLRGSADSEGDTGIGVFFEKDY